MEGQRRAYIVRDADTPTRPGKVFKLYPYTLSALLEALDDARLRSYAGTAQDVVRVEGRERIVIRRFENGHEAAL